MSSVLKEDADLEQALENVLFEARGKIPSYIMQHFSLDKGGVPLKVLLSLGKLMKVSRPPSAKNFQIPTQNALAPDWSSLEKMVADLGEDLTRTNPVDTRQWSFDSTECILNGDGSQSHAQVVRCNSCGKVLLPSVLAQHYEKCKEHTEKKKEREEQAAQALIESNKLKRKREDSFSSVPQQVKKIRAQSIELAEDTYLTTDMGKIISGLLYETVAITGPPSEETVNKVLNAITENKPAPLHFPQTNTFLFSFVKPTPIPILNSKPVKFRRPHVFHYSHPTVTLDIETISTQTIANMNTPEPNKSSPTQTAQNHSQSELLSQNGQQEVKKEMENRF